MRNIKGVKVMTGGYKGIMDLRVAGSNFEDTFSLTSISINAKQ